jgi:glycosyltransferase involved in cell wall biosynthesis
MHRDKFEIRNPQSEMTVPPFLSIVVPVYNEQESILPLYGKIRDAFEALGRPCEMVFVDDGSQDQTLHILEGIHRQDARVKVIRFRKNFGKTAAMAAGFRYARGEIIISMDGDLQNDPTDIPRLLNKLEEGYDVVCGWRRDRKDNTLTRTIPSVGANWLISKICGVRIHDSGCSLKAYRAPVIKRVSLYGEMHRFVPAMALLVGARVGEVVVHHHPRRFGQTKYGLSRMWKVFLDLFTVKMLVAFAPRPAAWFGLLSLPFWFGACIGTGAMALLAATGHGSPLVVVGSVTLLLTCTAIQLICMGILGEATREAEYTAQHPHVLPQAQELRGN